MKVIGTYDGEPVAYAVSFDEARELIEGGALHFNPAGRVGSIYRGDTRYDLPYGEATRLCRELRLVVLPGGGYGPANSPPEDVELMGTAERQAENQAFGEWLGMY